MKTPLRVLRTFILNSIGCCLVVPGLAIAALDTVRLEVMLNRGEIKEAQQFVAQSLKADGFKASAASVDNVIGWAYFSSGNVAQAELHLTSALHSAEEQGDRQIAILAANNLGIVNFTENRLDRAEFYFGMGYNADTDVAQEYRRLIDAKRREITLSKALEQGKQQRYEGNFEQAVASYETVLTLDPRNAAALEYKGYALYRLGRLDEAGSSLEEARSIDPSRSLVHLNIVKVQCAKNSEEGVQQAMERSTIPMRQFAEWYRSDGELSEVCSKSAAVQKVVAAYPNPAPAPA